MRVRSPFLVCVLALYALTAASSRNALLPYQNPALSAEARARDLVSRMTLSEKVAQLQNDAPAIPRLDVPAYNWWSEGLHGVARAGIATVFPQAIGLAATWDPNLVRNVARAISLEGRAKYELSMRRYGEARNYYGLTFFSPNVNIFRDPRWGRGQETYGEDPFLTATIGVAFVTGIQGSNSGHFRAIATAKHFAAHSGPVSGREGFDARVTPYDLTDTYLPQFESLVRDGHVDSVMTAYSAIDGVPDSANAMLFGLLRQRWGFRGYVVSDCDAVDDVYSTHHYTSSLETAAVAALDT
ncbi:MAG: glycoside hydrolase family 3 N-terminal domain-containing protein, partial [Rhodanobacteraceae bacterium]